MGKRGKIFQIAKALANSQRKLSKFPTQYSQEKTTDEQANKISPKPPYPAKRPNAKAMQPAKTVRAFYDHNKSIKLEHKIEPIKAVSKHSTQLDSVPDTEMIKEEKELKIQHEQLPLSEEPAASTPKSIPIDLQSNGSSVDLVDSFEQDIQAILDGEKQYDPETKKVSQLPLAQKTEKRTPKRSTEVHHQAKNSPHEVFDQMTMGLSDGHTHTFDLGAINLEEAFSDFDQQMEVAGKKQMQVQPHFDEFEQMDQEVTALKKKALELSLPSKLSEEELSQDVEQLIEAKQETASQLEEPAIDKTPSNHSQQQGIGDFIRKVKDGFLDITSSDEAKPKVAIILIPAIGGSNLISPSDDKIFKSGFGADRKATMVQEYILQRVLGLGSSAGDRNIQDALKTFGRWRPVEDHSGFGWDQVAKELYHPFLKACRENTDLPFEPDVYAIGYNFNQSNALSAKTILLRTREIMNSDEDYDGYIYITHSMGALPCRYMLKELSESPAHQSLYEKCLGVIHVAAPNLGAVEAMKRFITGMTEKSMTAFILGTSGPKFALAAGLIPSMCELFPIPPERSSVLGTSHPGRLEFPDFSSIVQEILSREYPKNLDLVQETMNIFRTNMTNANQFLDKLGSFVHPNSAALVLEGLETNNHIRYMGRKKGKQDGPREFEFETIKQGDGTVTVKSQRGYIKDEDMIATINDIVHHQPLSKKGKKEVFPALFKLMKKLHAKAEEEGKVFLRL